MYHLLHSLIFYVGNISVTLLSASSIDLIELYQMTITQFWAGVTNGKGSSAWCYAYRNSDFTLTDSGILRLLLPCRISVAVHAWTIHLESFGLLYLHLPLCASCEVHPSMLWIYIR